MTHTLNQEAILTMKIKTIIAGLLFGLAMGALAPRAEAQQLGTPTILLIDERNGVNYNQDTSDVTKFATSSAIVPVSLMPAWTNGTGFLDIYAINGQPVRGLHSYRFIKFGLSTATPTPGAAIADVARLSLINHVWEIQDTNGVAMGSIMGQGFANGPAPPGSPAAQLSANVSIVGGTGAFVGVRGTIGGTALPTGISAVAQRQASVVEDPAYRRVNGGGNARWVMTIYPGDAPQVISISHADNSPVSDAKPAVAGELPRFAAAAGECAGHRAGERTVGADDAGDRVSRNRQPIPAVLHSARGHHRIGRRPADRRVAGRAGGGHQG